MTRKKKEKPPEPERMDDKTWATLSVNLMFMQAFTNIYDATKDERALEELTRRVHNVKVFLPPRAD